MKPLVITFVLSLNYPGNGGPQRLETSLTGPDAAATCATMTGQFMREGAWQVPAGGSLKTECLVKRPR